MRASELDYELPEELIAQQPPERRDGARLLCLRRGDSAIEHGQITELARWLDPGTLLVLNDARVIPARLFGNKPSGGKVEFLLVERLGATGQEVERLGATGHDERWLALGKASKGLRVGERVALPGSDLAVEILARRDHGEVEIRLSAPGPVAERIASIGALPLPPYIRRPATAADAERYQTVFARHDGAVAAPTAGLHFSTALLAELEAAGHSLARLTLYVGPGTFAPLRVEELDEHPMHAERFHVPEETAAAIAAARAEGRTVLAIGTTVVRALESAVADDGTLRAGEGRTNLFIRPPYQFRAVDALLTNFHLPRSTLLALVMAFGGEEPVRAAYREAVAARYRFFSYGDAMLIRSAAR
jgi:S-adenosylmethionine:tRNA ribosyltransferase-isomerase